MRANRFFSKYIDIFKFECFEVKKRYLQLYIRCFWLSKRVLTILVSRLEVSCMTCFLFNAENWLGENWTIHVLKSTESSRRVAMFGVTQRLELLIQHPAIDCYGSFGVTQSVPQSFASKNHCQVLWPAKDGQICYFDTILHFLKKLGRTDLWQVRKIWEIFW